MKPARRYKFRFPHYVTMRELEEGDHPSDYEGRPIPGWVPGDYLVIGPFYKYVLQKELANKMYEEITDADQPRADAG